MALLDRKFLGVTAGIFSLLLLLSACSGTLRKQELMRLARAAEANYQSGKLGAAKKKYEALLAANPKYLTAHLRLGAIAYHEGDAKTARTQFELAATLDPENSQAKYNLAMLNLNEARALLNDYVALAPQVGNREKVFVLLAHLNAFGSR